MTVLAALVAVAGIVVTGLATLRVARVRGSGPAEHGALALVAGLGLTIVVLVAPLLVTGRVAFLPALALHAGCAVGLAWRLARGGVARPTRATCAVVTLAIVLGGGLARLALVDPFHGYDAKAIYGFKAKVLLQDRDLDGRAFQDPEVVHYHADYPLGLPLVMAYCGWLAEAGAAPAGPAVPAESAEEWVEEHDEIEAYVPVAALWVLGIVGLLAAGSRVGSGWRARAVLLAAGLAPTVAFPWLLGRSASWAGADLPLTLLLGATGVCLSRAVTGNARWLGVAVLAAGTGLLCKNDAMLGLPALAAATLVLGRPRRALAAVAGLVVGVLPFVWTVLSLRARVVASPFDEDYVAALRHADLHLVAARVPELARSAWSTLDGAHLLPFWLFVVFVGLPVCFRERGPARFFATWTTLHLLATAAVFLVTPDQITWHVVTAFPRVLGQAAVPAAFVVMQACARTWESWQVGAGEAVASAAPTATS